MENKLFDNNDDFRNKISKEFTKVLKIILLTALSVTVHLSIPLLNGSLMLISILSFINGLIYGYVAYRILSK